MTLSCIVGENRDTKPTQISKKKKGERQMGGGGRRTKKQRETDADSRAHKGWNTVNPFSQGSNKSCFNFNPQLRLSRHPPSPSYSSSLDNSSNTH